MLSPGEQERSCASCRRFCSRSGLPASKGRSVVAIKDLESRGGTMSERGWGEAGGGEGGHIKEQGWTV